MDVADRTIRVRLVKDEEHFSEVLMGWALTAKVSLWISTANLKELHIPAPIGSRARAKGAYVSVLETLTSLVRSGVELRILHGGIPSRPFRAELTKQKELNVPGKVLRMCPRLHMKLVVADGGRAYVGSANFTGAGFGAKGAGRRNFELGVVTDDPNFLDETQARFDRIWSGKECGNCSLRRVCPEPIDLLIEKRKARKARANAPTAVPRAKARTSLRPTER